MPKRRWVAPLVKHLDSCYKTLRHNEPGVTSQFLAGDDFLVFISAYPANGMFRYYPLLWW